MNALFVVLLLAAIVALIVGLTNPSAVKMKSRKQVGLVFSAVIIVLCIFIGSTSSPSSPTATAVAPVTTPAATTASAPEPTETPTPAPTPTPKKVAPVVAPEPVVPTPPAPTPAPAPAYQPSTLLSISGSGTKSTQTFTVPTNNWQLSYTYDCSSFGTSGNFQVMVYNSDGSMSFDDSMVNELGRSGADTQYYHVGEGSYYLEVNSECAWTVNVKG